MRHIDKIIGWIKTNQAYCIVAFLGFILYLLISISRYVHFGSTGFDLVIFDQAIRNYSHFQAPASSFRGFSNLLGDHFHPILVLLAPLYWIWDSPVVLLIAQAFLTSLATLPIYLYAKNQLNKKYAVLFVIIYAINPALLRMIYFDFHEIAFAVPLIAWALFLTTTKRWNLLYIPLLLLLLVKEDISILVSFFGVYLLILKRYKQGILIFLIGIVWFFFATKIAIPFFGSTYNYWDYAELGPNLPSSILAIIGHPVFVLSLLFLPVTKTLTLIKTLGVFLGFEFLSPIIVLAIPLILERMLSTNENYWLFNFHYGATLTPILVFATIDSLKRLYNMHFMKRRHAKYVIPIIITIIAVLSALLLVISPMNLVFKPSNYHLNQEERSGYETLAMIPAHASVCTTNHIAAHLGKHELHLLTASSITIESSCDYIITSSVTDESEQSDSRVNSVIMRDYSLLSSRDGWKLYRR